MHTRRHAHKFNMSRKRKLGAEDIVRIQERRDTNTFLTGHAPPLLWRTKQELFYQKWAFHELPRNLIALLKWGSGVVVLLTQTIAIPIVLIDMIASYHLLDL